MTGRTLLLATLILVPSVSSAYQLRTDESGTAVRFESKELVFRLPARLPAGLDRADVDKAIKAALASWAEVSGLTVTVVAGPADAAVGYESKGADNYNDILFVEQGWRWDDNAIAATVLTIDTTRHFIVDADIVLNAAQHRFRVLAADSKAGGIYDDLQNAVTHEAGHALGLGHTSVTDAAMYPQSAKGEVGKRTLKEDDLDGISALYLPNAPTEPDPNLSPEGKAVQGMAVSMATMGCSASAAAPSALAVLLVVLPFFFLLRPAPARVRVRRDR